MKILEKGIVNSIKHQNKGGSGILVTILCFELFLFIVTPLFIFLFQMGLFFNEKDKLMADAEIVSYKTLEGVSISSFSEGNIPTYVDLSDSYSSNLKEFSYEEDHIRNVKALLTPAGLSVEFEYLYEVPFWGENKWLLCQLSYGLPINN